MARLPRAGTLARTGSDAAHNTLSGSCYGLGLYGDLGAGLGLGVNLPTQKSERETLEHLGLELGKWGWLER